MVQAEESDDVRELDYSPYESQSSDQPLRIRLEDETSELVENSLRGKSYNNETGVYGRSKGVNPICNESGVQRVMTFFRGIINKTSWQGNIKKDEHNRAMEKYHLFIGEQLAINQAEWGVSENELSFIPGVLELPVFFSTSRSLDNLERESYGGGRVNRTIVRGSKRRAPSFFSNQQTENETYA